MIIIMLFTVVRGRRKCILVGLLYLFLASATCCSGCLESERRALHRFQQGLVDDANVLSSWGREDDCCQWRGVACNKQTGHVVALNLSNGYPNYCDFNPPKVPLRGEISPSLLELPYLDYLDLSSVDFEGIMIPMFIGSLSRLNELKLASNNFSGPLPPQLGNLFDLQTLDLSFNKLEGGIPKSFQHLCNLEMLNLSSNHLSENIEDSLRTLSCAENTLETLSLTMNQFWGSLPELSRFSKLKELNLNINQVNGSLPESLGQLSSLEKLSVSGNNMIGIITDSHFLNLSHLHHLDLSGNRFSMNLSSGWSPRFQLHWLGLSSCKVGLAIPKWILVQKNLTGIFLSNAGLTGSLPTKFLDLCSRLEELDLSMNQFHGKVPNLSSTILRYVNLSSNLFCGAVPSLPQHLNYLYLSNNKLSEPLSSLCATQQSVELGLINLEILDLSGNLLSGELPNCWVQFRILGVLDLGRNRLSGIIPSTLGNLLGLQILRLNQNNFLGEFPSLHKCTELALLDLGDNHLSGNIPEWIGQSLTNLQVLRLRSNEFNGIIPSSLCSLATIHVLDLSHNNISGGLPLCLNNITAFKNTTIWTIGDISPSSWTMKLVWKGIEIEFGKNLDAVRSIDLSSNYLVGEIPQSITSMTEIISLNLSRNNLAGELPEHFGNMKMLESLDLSRNRIYGKIPASFSRLNYLGVLDVSHNNLSGRIPVGTQLQSFNASAYMGNLKLCGVPLAQICPGDRTTEDDRIMIGNATDKKLKEHDIDTVSLKNPGFLISTVLGFVSGFWIVCGSLMLKSSWRYAYFKFLDDLTDWFYVKMAVYKAKMLRRL